MIDVEQVNLLRTMIEAAERIADITPRQKLAQSILSQPE
jgi:hypothetical protein